MIGGKDPYWFSFVTKLTTGAQNETPMCMTLLVNVIIIYKNTNALEDKLQRQQERK